MAPSASGAGPRDRDPDPKRAAAIAREAGDRWLTAGETRSLLQSYGIPVVEERAAASVDEAVAAAEELGYPVVLKTAVAGAHKTEVGGVALDIRDEAAVATRPSTSVRRFSCNRSFTAASSCSSARLRILCSGRLWRLARAALWRS